MNRVDGRIAVVTGGTQGLGAAIARRLAASGAAAIVTCGRNRAKGDAVAGAIATETGVETRFVEADLARIDDCRRVIAAADAAFGRIDILVNAAGMTDRGGLLDTTPEIFERTFAVNARAPFFLMQAAARCMVRDGTEGAIVNIGSVAATTGQPFIAAYSMSKAALETLTRNAAYALLRNRIRVNQLNIGWMASEGEDRIQRAHHGAADGWQQEAGAALPFGRLVDPEEVARAATYLASADSGLMTGAVIRFDQSVLDGYSFSPPAPDAPAALPDGEQGA